MSFFLVSGGAEAAASIIEEYNILRGPDLYERTCVNFGIDDARELITRAAVRAIEAEHRTFIIAASGITVEAQNALLKTLEEPPAGAAFYLIVPSPEALLATVRSRAQKLVVNARAPIPTIAKKFLAAQPKDRIDLLKPLLDKKENEVRDTTAILSFLAELEALVGARPALHAIYRARKYISDKGALAKPLLESVALLV